MARPIKQGLDYFPMDVTTDDKFELIEAKHGLVGFGIIIKLFQQIYKEGYYLKWNEEIALIFKKKINVDINLLNAVINDIIEYNILSKSCFNKYKILTSAGIQKRYFAACERRTGIEIIKKYIIVDINSINVNNNKVNDNKKYTKESKENESKINKIKPGAINLISSFELLLNDEQWQQAVIDYDKRINSPEQVKEVLKKFMDKLKLSGNHFPATIQETKQYFTNWLAKYEIVDNVQRLDYVIGTNKKSR